jgi:ParB/RepB/Spo0J family partition protein
MNLKIVDISTITEDDRARKEYGNLEELKLSLTQHGLIQPIAVEAMPNETYRLLAGGRRLRAVKELGWETIGANVYDIGLTELKKKSIELAENLDRLDLSWHEKVLLQREIHEMQQLIHGKKVAYNDPEAVGWDQKATAEMLHKSPASLSMDMKLAEALDSIPELRECKTKDEASKMFRQIQERMIREELSKRSLVDSLAKQKQLIDSYIIGDFFANSKSIPTGSIHLCEVDPPFAIGLKDHKENQNDIKDYEEWAKETYLAKMAQVISECSRVLSDSGWLILWFAQDWGEALHKLLQLNDFRVPRTNAIWTKPGVVGSTSRPEWILGSAYETFFYAGKANANIIKQGRHNVFSFPPIPPNNKVHPTERPIEMITDVIKTFTLENSRILVPFLGSGNTLLAAANLGMSAFGYDTGTTFKEDFILKVISEEDGFYNSYGRI